MALALATLISATWAADAGAATIDWGPTLSITAGPGERNTIRIRRTVGVHSPTALAILNDGTSSLDDGGLSFSDTEHCRRSGPPGTDWVFCDLSDPAVGITITALSISLGDINDNIQFDDDGGLPANVVLGSGDDGLSVFPTHNPQVGPMTVDAGAGFDGMTVDNAADTIDGGPDNDIFGATVLGATINGGDGVDSIGFGVSSGVTAQIGVGGIGADVEQLAGTDFDDHLIGSSGANDLAGLKGNDVIEGGGGADRLFGNEGDDDLRSNDGEADTVSCGEDNDRVVADALDTLNVDCEQVDVGVTITSGPSGVVAEDSARFEFAAATASPPAGHLECGLDGGAFAECSSPKAFAGLSPGEHVFQVRYKPDGRPAGSLSERRWSIQTACPDVRVGLVVVQGCFTERVVDGAASGVFETEGEAWIGGFHVVPRPGGKLVVQNRPAAPLAAEGAGVDWVLGPVAVPAPLDDLHPFLPDFTAGLNTAGSFERFLALPFLNGNSAQAKVTWDAGGRGSKLEASVSMEELTKNLGKPFAGQDGNGVSVGTLAAKLSATFVNGKPADLADGELEVPEFAVELKGTNPPIKKGFGGAKLKAARTGASVEWSGEVSVLFPWKGEAGPNQGVVKGRLSFLDTQIAGLGFSLSGFEQPIGRTGWDLTGIEGDVLFRPSFAFNVGVQAQQHSSFAGVNLLKATGNLKALKLAEPDCAAGPNPVEFVGTFNAPPLEDQKIGELKGQVLMCGYVGGRRNFAFEAGVSGALTVDFPPATKVLSATGSAKGWFSGFDFNLDGSYSLMIPLIGKIAASGVFSSEGYAFCGQYGFISAGFATNNWLEAPTDLTGCDFTPFRVATRPASASAAATGVGVRVPARQTAFGFAVRGRSGAPAVRLTGPRGEHFSSRAGKEAKGKRAIILPIDDLKTTYVYLRNPRGGVWRMTPQGHGAGIKRVDTASQLPDPRVRARVTRRGAKVEVAWRSNKVPGRKIQLVDRAASGTATIIQKRTLKTRGRVTFTPANPLVARRRIEAVTFQNGSPRPPITAARYKLKSPKRPGRAAKPTAKRTGAGLAIAWRTAPRASEYVITIKTAATVLTRITTRKPKLIYTDPPPGPLSIQITPRDRYGRTGPSTTLKTG